MGDLIPLQRYVLIVAAPSEDDAEQPEGQQQGGGMNPYAQPNGGSTQTQRTVYTNTHEYDNDTING